MAASSRQGVPLLSGPPPPPPSPPDVSACRKCGKEFGILFNRQRKCMHCGYTYCTSCADYQALMPRPGPARGHDLAHVCACCIELLNVTSLGRNQLNRLPLSKLRRYVDAYNIPLKGAVDKLDIIDALIATRTPQGCLPAANEAYYRKHAVPKHSSRGGSSHPSATAYARNLFNRATSNNPPPTTSRTGSGHAGNNSRTSNNATNHGANPRAQAFPRPDLDAVYGHPETNRRPYASQSAPASGGRARATSSYGSPRTPNNSRSQAPHEHPRATSFSRPNHPTSDRPTPTPPAPAAPVAPPPLETLLTRPRSSISTLSVAVLKKILWEAHVRIPPGVCEKEDLVDRVWTFLEEERRRVDGNSDEDYPEGFESEGSDAQPGLADPGYGSPSGSDHNNDHIYDELGVLGPERMGGDDGHLYEIGAGSRSRAGTPYPLGSQSQSGELHTSTDSMRSKAKSQHGKHVETERSGLCVICQDAEANIAIVDCGHLAMCRECSDLVMQSSRECPLCRTRIVTEARLLRIFKT